MLCVDMIHDSASNFSGKITSIEYTQGIDSDQGISRLEGGMTSSGL